MSIHTDPTDGEFIQIRRALALKKHEQPPPGYFEQFSRDVIDSLRTASSEDARAEVFLEQVPWLYRFLQSLQARPVFAGAVGAMVCALLIGGILFSEQPQSTAPSGGLRGIAEAEFTVMSDGTHLGVTAVDSMEPAIIMVASNDLSVGAPNLFNYSLTPSSMPAGGSESLLGY